MYQLDDPLPFKTTCTNNYDCYMVVSPHMVVDPHTVVSHHMVVKLLWSVETCVLTFAKENVPNTRKSLKLVLLAHLGGQNSFKTEASDVFSTHKWKKILLPRLKT